jgi:hypothetical protein
MIKPTLLVATLCLLLIGCATSSETLANTNPLGYDDAMESLATELRLVDKYVTGGQYNLAEPKAARATTLAGYLEQYEPPRMGKSYADYQEFQNQAIDMQRGADRLAFLVEQRRRDEANEQMLLVIDRYNHISRRYGPGINIDALARDEGRMRGPTSAQSNLPGDVSRR